MWTFPVDQNMSPMSIDVYHAKKDGVLESSTGKNEEIPQKWEFSSNLDDLDFQGHPRP